MIVSVDVSIDAPTARSAEGLPRQMANFKEFCESPPKP